MVESQWEQLGLGAVPAQGLCWVDEEAARPKGCCSKKGIFKWPGILIYCCRRPVTATAREQGRVWLRKKQHCLGPAAASPVLGRRLHGGARTQGPLVDPPKQHQSQGCKWEVGGEGAPGLVGTGQSVLLSPEGLAERNKGTQIFLDEALPMLLPKRTCSSSYQSKCMKSV